jgi:hypothetical protein
MSAEDVLVQIGVTGSINLQTVLNNCTLLNGQINVGSVVGGVFTIRLEAQLRFQVGCTAYDGRCSTPNFSMACFRPALHVFLWYSR